MDWVKKVTMMFVCDFSWEVGKGPSLVPLSQVSENYLLIVVAAYRIQKILCIFRKFLPAQREWPR